MDKIYKEQIENLKNELKEEKERKKIMKSKAQEQRESDIKEILDLEKNLEEVKEELANMKKEKIILAQDKKNLEEINTKLIKSNKEIKIISNQMNNNDLIVNNYKSILDKKNLQIDNLN